MITNLAHTDNAPENQTYQARILVMGPAARGIAGALLRLESRTEICAADTPAEAVACLKSGSFDHVLIDNRADGSMALSIPLLASSENIGRLTVLAGPKSRDEIAAVPGVGQVITSPYNPVEIATSLGLEIKDSRTNNDPDHNKGRRVADKADTEFHGEVEETSADKSEDEDMRPVFIRVLSALVHFVPGLTPIISLLYKNAALTMLASLFLAFTTYGLMIVFFLTSGDWSSPIQLQAGHEMVIKAERERGELQVKRNLVRQQLTSAEAKAKRGENALKRANILSQIVTSTLEQEIENQKDQQVLLEADLESLNEILKNYGTPAERKAERSRLRKAFKQRVITRDYFQRGMMGVSQIEEKIVNLTERISRKQRDLQMGIQSVTYLVELKSELAGNSDGKLVGTGKAEYVPIANQVIEVQQLRASAAADLADFDTTRNTLDDSISVLSKSINALDQTPMIEALSKPVNVLFVPYDNLNSYQKGESLYTCGFAIFWCREVGTVGNPIGGEITTTHPFFGKPIRGQFVEANLTEISAAQEEIIHVGRPPLFF